MIDIFVGRQAYGRPETSNICLFAMSYNEGDAFTKVKRFAVLESLVCDRSILHPVAKRVIWRDVPHQDIEEGECRSSELSQCGKVDPVGISHGGV